MSEQRDLATERASGEPYNIEKEKLDGSNTELTSFYFHQGANVYVFSYLKEGIRRHTLIDAGDVHYRNHILSLLIKNDVNPANIERIFITHRHPDHCGLAALLAKQSGAKILVHFNFRSFIEGEDMPEGQRWSGFAPSQLRECDIEYMPQPGSHHGKVINGVNFPGLMEPIEIGKSGKLMILTPPESTPTHSSDQIIILYSPENKPHIDEKGHENLLPTDSIIFAGDLWLMSGPMFHRNANNAAHRRFRLMQKLIPGKKMPWRDAREQDPQAKEALKKGFHLIRVKPGHGGEFIGSSIIPSSLLADRDLLLALGFAMNAKRSILKQKEMTPRIAALREQAYTNFIREILFWADLGYTRGEISALLTRIYKEQSGGGILAAEDRKQRRVELKATLTRLKDDKAESEELHQLAQSTLSEVKKVT